MTSGGCFKFGCPHGLWGMAAAMLFIGYKPFCVILLNEFHAMFYYVRCKDTECFLEKHLFCRVFASAALFLLSWASYRP